MPHSYSISNSKFHTVQTVSKTLKALFPFKKMWTLPSSVNEDDMSTARENGLQMTGHVDLVKTVHLILR
jgi:hypothetical protein